VGNRSVWLLPLSGDATLLHRVQHSPVLVLLLFLALEIIHMTNCRYCGEGHRPDMICKKMFAAHSPAASCDPFMEGGLQEEAMSKPAQSWIELDYLKYDGRKPEPPYETPGEAMTTGTPSDDTTELVKAVRITDPTAESVVGKFAVRIEELENPAVSAKEWKHLYAYWRDRAEELEAELAGAQQDAARYRWLRDRADPDMEQPFVTIHQQDSWGNWRSRVVEQDNMDAAIDTARKP